MIDEMQTFTTDSSPDERGFERTVRDATSHLAEALQSADPEYYGAKKEPVLMRGVRTALRTDGLVTRKRVERVISSRGFAEKYDRADREVVLEALNASLRGDGQ